MFKRFIRWILPLVVLMLIAAYLVLSPILATHAAAPVRSTTTTSNSAAPQGPAPDLFWQP